MTHRELIMKGLNDWAAYYRRKLTDTVATMYLEKISPYKTETVEYLFKTVLEQEERWPSLRFVINFLQRTGENLNVEYDPEGDQRYPIGLMDDGYTILVNDGERAFNSYCNRYKMPLDERNAIMCKKNAVYNAQDLYKPKTIKEQVSK